jgi:RNA polymerase sigma factor (sigma-70 family)
MPQSDNLTREEEIDLARRWRDSRDERARVRILQAYRKMAIAFAQRALRPGAQLDDLVQEAQIGLVTALDRFDPELGFSFSTFARYHVLSRLQIHALENLGPVRIFNTAATKSLLASYFRLRRNYEEPGTGRLGEEGRAAICRELGIPREQLDRFEMAIQAPAGIDVGAGEDPDSDLPRGRQILAEDDPEKTVVCGRALEQARAVLAEALAGLDPRDAEVLRRRHLAESPETLDAIAASLGVSRERVRQIEARGLSRVRKALEAAGIKSATAFFG